MTQGARAPIAVICAIRDELSHLEAALPPGLETWHGNRSAWVTALDGQPIVLALCGIGMLSAAAVAEAVITHHRPSAVLNFGCAGAHRRDLLLGDIVIADRVVAYDNVREGTDGAQRYVGMRYLHRGHQRGYPERIPFLPTDSDLLACALRVGAALDGQHEPWPASLRWPELIPHRSPRLVVGTVASADRWNRTPASIEAIVGQHDSACEDMEAAAIALGCASHDVPFLTIKDISNNELLAATTVGHALPGQVRDEIGRRAAGLVLAILRDLARWPSQTA